MDVRKIRQIAKILQSEGLEELEFQDGETYLRLKKAFASTQEVQTIVQVEKPEVETGDSIEKSEKVEEGQLILSPLAGTFYKAKSPGAAPFVSIGDTVKKGQTLCILEAMKLMNELEAEQACTILDILVNDAEPVAEGQAIFRVKSID